MSRDMYKAANVLIGCDELEVTFLEQKFTQASICEFKDVKISSYSRENREISFGKEDRFLSWPAYPLFLMDAIMITAGATDILVSSFMEDVAPRVDADNIHIECNPENVNNYTVIQKSSKGGSQKFVNDHFNDERKNFFINSIRRISIFAEDEAALGVINPHSRNITVQAKFLRTNCIILYTQYEKLVIQTANSTNSQIAAAFLSADDYRFHKENFPILDIRKV
jgi:hypothetical protein